MQLVVLLAYLCAFLLQSCLLPMPPLAWCDSPADPLLPRTTDLPFCRWTLEWFAELCRDLQDTDTGWRPSGSASRYCEVHTRMINVGLRLLLPLHYHTHDCILFMLICSYATVSDQA
jgi:hypothetical protein